jgi:inosine-uridine nucleoside N-ribohydrolase
MLASMTTSFSGAPPRIILDCDPGHDDAVAIVAAAHSAELLGITTVAGNAPLSRTTHNALIIRDLLAIDVPVHAGADRPLVLPPVSGPDIHGRSGLDGADLPEPTTPLDGHDAIAFIVDTCRSTDDVWLVPTGPQTNIALALRAAPDLAGRIAGISFMGGGSYGNRTAAAEYNIWADPHAAAIVIDSGTRLVMAGLDVTHRFQATPERIDAVERVGGTLASALADLFRFFSASYLRRHDDGALRGAAVHDPLAVLALTHPRLFEREAMHVSVETDGALTRGMTVLDRRRLVERPAPNCEVLTDVDADGAFGVVLEAIARFSATAAS